MLEEGKIWTCKKLMQGHFEVGCVNMDAVV